MMLEPDAVGTNTNYYEIQINPQNKVFKSQFDTLQQPARRTRTRARSATRTGTPSSRAPLPSRRAPTARPPGTSSRPPSRGPGTPRPPTRRRKPGDVWRLNFYAMKNNGGRAWSPILGQGNFHKAARFGKVTWAVPGGARRRPPRPWPRPRPIAPRPGDGRRERPAHSNGNAHPTDPGSLPSARASSGGLARAANSSFVRRMPYAWSMRTIHAAGPLAVALVLASSAASAQRQLPAAAPGPASQPGAARAAGPAGPKQQTLILEKEQLGTAAFASVARARMRNGDCAGALDAFDAAILHSIDASPAPRPRPVPRAARAPVPGHRRLPRLPHRRPRRPRRRRHPRAPGPAGAADTRQVVARTTTTPRRPRARRGGADCRERERGRGRRLRHAPTRRPGEAPTASPRTRWNTCSTTTT